MSATLPWGKKKTDEEIAAELDLRKKQEEESGNDLVAVQEEPQPAKKRSSDLVTHKPRSTGLTHIQRNNDILIRKGHGGDIIQVRSKEVVIAGVKRKVDP